MSMSWQNSGDKVIDNETRVGLGAILCGSHVFDCV